MTSWSREKFKKKSIKNIFLKIIEKNNGLSLIDIE